MNIPFILHGLVVVMALLLLIPVIFFTIQCWLGLCGLRQQPRYAKHPESEPTADILVLIPAHNEMQVIAKTLQSIVPQLASTDRLLVVADNCHDETAAIVKSMQQQVVVRNNTQQTGKGYALAYGLDSIRDKPPAILVIIDADCRVLPNFVEQLRQHVMQTGLSAQSMNLMYAPDNAPVSVKISAFAVLVKNRIRMIGMNQLAGHVPLLGTGMAFPWQTIQGISLANGEIAEDIYLGLQLVLQQQGATFAPTAELTSALPVDADIQQGQRERWEHGHIDLIKRMLPPLLKQAIKQRSWPIFATALDLSIPPLSLLILLNAGLWVLALLAWWLTGFSFAFLLSSASLLMISVTVLACWRLIGHAVLSFKDLLQVPAYIWQKLAIYRTYLVAKQTKWIKTKR